jgi:phage FluMu protein Com
MSKIEDEVCEKIQNRAEQARVEKPCPKCGHADLKYNNKTMERNDLSNEEWLIHAQEEAMDLAVYLQKLITTQIPSNSTQELESIRKEYIKSKRDFK